MPFSFLNPWFWLGALAVAAPIWLHLRRKKQTNLLPFSAVRFLEDQPEPRRSPWRLRDYLLFALRTLALLLLVTAFSWPYLRGANTVPIDESRVYILDNTLSRQANNGFTEDRARLQRELSRAGPEFQVAVVELTSSPRVLVGFSEDRRLAEQKVQELEPSHQRGSYLAAFRQANGLLNNSLGEHKRIILLGDNQENQWTENVNSPPFLRRIEIELPKPSHRSLPNTSLSEPRAQRIFLGDKSLITFSAKLTHTGPAPDANIILRGNGQTILNRSVELRNQPETILLQAQWEADPAAWLRGELTVEASPDALPADNTAFFALPPLVEGKLALLAQSRYVRLALSPEIMRGRWATRVLDPANLASETATNLDAEVLCLESSYLQSAEARKLVSRYLSNGRGVFLIVNRLSPAIDAALRELGFDADGVAEPGKDSPERFQFVVSNHPVFHPFISPEFGNLLDIRVSEYAQLRSTQAMPLIFSERGAGLFFQSSKFPGKLFVSAFGMDREQSSWPIHQTFIPFLDLTLQAARAEDPTPTAFEPGEMVVLALPGSTGSREAVLRQGDRELARGFLEHGRAQVRLPDQPGLYDLTFDDSLQVQKVFSVNPSPKESQLAYIQNPEVLNAWRSSSALEAAQKNSTPARAQVRMAGILQQRLWWWMVLGGLLALFLELALAEARKARA